MGTLSSQTLSSVTMIFEGLKGLKALLQELNSNFEIDLHTCLTVQVENLHATGHFKEQFPTLLYSMHRIWPIQFMKVLNELCHGQHITSYMLPPTIIQ